MTLNYKVITVDNKSLEMLEFPKVKEILAGYTSFSASRQLALSLQPSSNSATISQLLKQSAEARHLLTLEPDFSNIDSVMQRFRNEAFRERLVDTAYAHIMDKHTYPNRIAAIHALITAKN